MRGKFCPKCNGKSIKMVAGGSIGLFECNKCHFQSALFPEKGVDMEIKFGSGKKPVKAVKVAKAKVKKKKSKTEKKAKTKTKAKTKKKPKTKTKAKTKKKR